MIGKFSYQCKGMSGTAASHVFCSQAMKWWGSNFKVTGNKRFYNALLLDKFKQLDASQLTKLYPDTYSLRILSLNSSFVTIERKVAHVL